MCRLIESIKIKNGKIYNLSFHNRRMNEARFQLLDCRAPVDLAEVIPSGSKEGIMKCRIIYDREVRDIQFIPYELPEIKSLQLVVRDDIHYPFKFENREQLTTLYKKRGKADDILIVKEGQITDTYFCNVVFERAGVFYTPASCLLKGTKRQQLLDEGRINSRVIRAEEISNFEKLYLINAMIDIDDDISMEMKKVLF